MFALNAMGVRTYGFASNTISYYLTCIRAHLFSQRGYRFLSLMACMHIEYQCQIKFRMDPVASSMYPFSSLNSFPSGSSAFSFFLFSALLVLLLIRCCWILNISLEKMSKIDFHYIKGATNPIFRAIHFLTCYIFIIIWCSIYKHIFFSLFAL